MYYGFSELAYKYGFVKFIIETFQGCSENSSFLCGPLKKYTLSLLNASIPTQYFVVCASGLAPQGVRVKSYKTFVKLQRDRIYFGVIPRHKQSSAKSC